MTAYLCGSIGGRDHRGRHFDLNWESLGKPAGPPPIVSRPAAVWEGRTVPAEGQGPLPPARRELGRGAERLPLEWCLFLVRPDDGTAADPGETKASGEAKRGGEGILRKGSGLFVHASLVLCAPNVAAVESLRSLDGRTKWKPERC